MKYFTRILILILTISYSNTILSQKKKKIVISGYVKDSLNKPISGCIIYIDEIKQKRKTNRKGFYSLKLKNTPKKLLFYSYRHGITEIDFPGKSNIDITFKKMGTKQKEKFEKIKNSDSTNKNRYRFTNIYSYLRGQVPGVRVFSDNKIIVRGITSLLGSNEPLFILNKMAVNKDALESINPNDIKSVKVLKGSETSIYGVRGAAGVIVITTY